MVRRPQTAVKSGSQILGDIFFSTKFDGNSLSSCQLCTALNDQESVKEHLPRNIRRVEYAQSNRILVVIDVYVFLQTKNLCVSDIRPIDERTQKQQRENREDAIISSQ